MSLQIVASVADAERHSDDVQAVLYHSGRLFSGADDGKVKVWSPDLELQCEVQAHYCSVCDLAVDGSRLYTCSDDNTIKQWDLASWKLLRTMVGHQSSVRRLYLSQGKLYSGDDNGELHVWQDGQEVASYHVVEEVWDLLIRNDLAYTVRDRDVTITQLLSAKNHLYCTKKSMIGRAPLCIVGDKLCFCSREGTTVYVHSNDGKEYPQVTVLEGHKMIINALTGADSTLYSAGWDSTIRAWNMDTFVCTAVADVTNYVTAICVGEPGEIYAGGMDGFICKLKSS